jgi:hypothetical protein
MLAKYPVKLFVGEGQLGRVPLLPFDWCTNRGRLRSSYSKHRFIGVQSYHPAGWTKVRGSQAGNDPGTTSYIQHPHARTERCCF